MPPCLQRQEVILTQQSLTFFKCGEAKYNSMCANFLRREFETRVLSDYCSHDRGQVAVAMEKDRLAYFELPQDVVLRRGDNVRGSGSGRVLSALLVTLGVVCCLAWMGGLVQLPFNSPTPER